MCSQCLVSYNVVISACGKAKQPEKAMSLYQEMEENGVKPDSFTCTGLITAFAKVSALSCYLVAIQLLFSCYWFYGTTNLVQFAMLLLCVVGVFAILPVPRL